MDTRVRTALQTMKTPTKSIPTRVKEKEKDKTLQRSRGRMEGGKATGTSKSRKERKIALQQDVDKLKRKLQHEENVHRALERAFTRPLGALPRLPPYLPPQTLELLAEVAVLEEEVVRLEEQIVNCRQGLYQEAINISSSKKAIENSTDLYPCPNDKKPEHASPAKANSNSDRNDTSSNRIANGKSPLKKPSSCSPATEDRRGKENHLGSNCTKQSPQKKLARIRNGGAKKNLDAQMEKAVETTQTTSDATVVDVGGSPNRISEDTLKCLMEIFSRMSLEESQTKADMVPSVSGFDEIDVAILDLYRICPVFGRRDLGPYKRFRSIDQDSVDPNLEASCPLLIRKLKLLLRKLGMVDLRGLNHQQKLAFWINVYNSCMMNAILEHGIPASPEVVVALMQKAMINVSGHLLGAMTIEHFILRLPYQSKYVFPKGLRNDEMAARSVIGLDWPEPLVTFALSCGSWSSPAVRVYTAAQVENELETAKREYLQAAVGISLAQGLAIPKLLDWYLLDFAKDIDSLMDWICLQLPSESRNEAVKCLERVRRTSPMRAVHVLPYDFSFRYILAK